MSKSNRGFRYILIVVDSLSRRIWAEPLKKKNAIDVSSALKRIFDSMKNDGILAEIALLSSDLGNEFWNVEVHKILEHFGISHFPLRPPLKCALVEGSGRWLMDRVYKHLHSESSTDWISQLPKFVHAKNSRKSRTLGGLAPIEVTYKNQGKVFDVLYPDRYKRLKAEKNPLTVGEKVQISTAKLPFAKSFHGYFSDKIYEVKRRHDYNGIFRYTLIDTTDNAEIAGTFHAAELQRFPSS